MVVHAQQLCEAAHERVPGYSVAVFTTAWRYLVSWIDAQMQDDTVGTIAIPMLGVIGFRRFKLGIRVPVFELDPKVQSFHRLQTTVGGTAIHSSTGPAMKPDLQVLGNVCGVDRDQAQQILHVLLTVWAELCAQGAEVVLDMQPVGVLTCTARMVTLTFTQKMDQLTKAAPTRPAGSPGRRAPQGDPLVPGVSPRVRRDRVALGSPRPEAGEPSPRIAPIWRPPPAPMSVSTATPMTGVWPSSSILARASPRETLEPVLDEFSRTRAAPLCDKQSARSAVERIGSSYSPHALLLTISAKSKTVTWLRPSSAGVDPQSISPRAAQLDRDRQEHMSAQQMTWSIRLGMSQSTPNASPRVSPRMALSPRVGPEALKLELNEDFFDDPITKLRGAANPVLSHEAYALSPRSSRFAVPPTAAADVNSVDLADVVRYYRYVAEAVPESAITPMDTMWMEHALSSIPKNLMTDDEVVSAVVTRTLAVVKREYLRSMARAILNYTIKLPSERQRLRLRQVPAIIRTMDWGYVFARRAHRSSLTTSCHSWGAQRLVPLTPPEHHRNFLQASMVLHDTLHILRPSMRAIVNLWGQYQSYLLVTLPGTEAEAWREAGGPVSVSELVATQTACCTAVRDQFISGWAEQCTQVVASDTLTLAGREACGLPPPSKPIDPASLVPPALLPSFYNAVATLMANQVRSTVERSIARLVTFFEAYRSAVDDIHITPALRVELQAVHVNADGRESATVAVFPNRTEVLDAMRAIFVGCLNAFCKVYRVELKLHGQPFGEARLLSGVESTEAPMEIAWASIRQVVHANCDRLNGVLHIYQQFEYLLLEAAQLEVTLAAEPSLALCQELISKYAESAAAIERNLPSSVTMGLFLVDCRSINAALHAKAKELLSRVLYVVEGRYVSFNAGLVKQFRAIATRLATVPTDSTALVEAEQFVDEVRYQQAAKHAASVETSRDMLNFLLDHDHYVGPELLQPLQASVQWLHRLEPMLRDADRMLMTARNKLESSLARARDEFRHNLTALAEQVASFRSRDDFNAAWANAEEIRGIQSALQIAAGRAKDMNDEADRLNILRATFSEVDDIADALEPYARLWETIVEHNRSQHEWFKRSVFTLDAAQISSDVDRMLALCQRLSKQLAEDSPTSVRFAAQIEASLQKFAKQLPLLRVMCNKSMQKRHWAQVSDVVGFNLRPDKFTDLSRLHDLGMDSHMDALEAISTAASQEYNIEKILQKIADEWTPAMFEMSLYKESRVSVLTGTCAEALQDMVDEHLIKVSPMLGSTYSKPFMRTIQELLHFLRNVAEILKLWLKVQADWLYLHPVFLSADMTTQLPDKATVFAQVDQDWRLLVASVVAAPACTSVVRVDGIVERLKRMQSALESVHAALAAYMEAKRQAFPRFYFLSNDELLEILSEMTPQRVLPHLPKLFEGIHTLTIQNAEVHSMHSIAGESVGLVGVLTSPTCEVWLRALEAGMCASIQNLTKHALGDPHNDETWLLGRTAQVVMTVKQLLWTRAIEQAIDSRTLAAVLTDQGTELANFVKLVRGDLNAVARTTLTALVTLSVHTRDVVQRLIDSNVADSSAFEWIAQLRYYWVDNTIAVRMLDAEQPYGWEYLGNTGRLVVTPLTERCYRTLMSAVNLQLGGAPEGPAGTGKTETVKDLAKALARFCIVFNCSDQLNAAAMSKFFKGLAASGSWACFDEFNRIQVEVLSVIAQQIVAIQQSIAQGADLFVFDGSELSLKPTAGVFITMNPGYAGRAELPDNLKILFRPVAMMVPDYSLIAEITLYSSGYLDARPLAKKIVATYRLCSEQLSSQQHYDYGMRAVIAVLRAAATLKRTHSHRTEEALIVRALLEVNVPKFLASDLTLFSGIISDLFVGMTAAHETKPAMVQAATAVCAELGLQPDPQFLSKVYQLYETMTVRHGFMVVGAAMCGKSAALTVLAATLCKLAEQKVSLGNPLYPAHELPVDMVVLNPKAVSLARLYGRFDPVSHDWTNGVLATAFKNAVAASTPTEAHLTPRMQWVVCDGPVDAEWVESMNTVLDDNKKLCLMSGEIVAMTPYMSIILETGDLASASPATVSRCGIVFCEPHNLSWASIFESWLLRTVPAALQAAIGIPLRGLMNWLLPSALHVLASGEWELIVSVSGPMALQGMLKVLAASLAPIPAWLAAGGNAQRGLVGWVEGAFLFAFVWGIGAPLTSDSRPKFERWLRKALSGSLIGVEKRALSAPLPTTATCFDFEFVPPTEGGVGQWVAWESSIPRDFVPPATQFGTVLIPTVETMRVGYLLRMAIRAGHNMLLVGPSGVGKSTSVQTAFRECSSESLETVTMLLTTNMPALVAQQVAESLMHRRRAKGIGAAVDAKLVMFVDDMGMPQREVYGAQPPLELLRQVMDKNGWYDLKTGAWTHIVDTSFIAAMTPSISGGTPVSQRVLRHMHVISVPTPDDTAMRRILSVKLAWHFGRTDFLAALGQHSKLLVTATLRLFSGVRSKLLATPAKCQYQFTLSDLDRLMRGIMVVQPAQLTDTKKATRLWVHEACRTFLDRLADPVDTHWFIGVLRETLHSVFGTSLDALCPTLDNNGDDKVDTVEELSRLLFSDSMNLISSAAPAVDEMPITNIAAIHSMFFDHAAAYASATGTKQLIMFQSAVEHTCRLTRAFKQSSGHACIIGMAGTGRRSLIRLASYMCKLTVVEPRLTNNYRHADWRTELQTIVTRCTVGSGRALLLLHQSVLVANDLICEDVHLMLNTGVVPTLFEPEQQRLMLEQLRPAIKESMGLDNPTPAQSSSYFVHLLRTNLHIALVLSPLGHQWRGLVRQYPSFVTCCHVNWMREWPADALHAVASDQLIPLPVTEQTRAALAQQAQYMHSTMDAHNAQVMALHRRQIYTTPSSFMQLLSLFQSLFATKHAELVAMRQRYNNGIAKLNSAETDLAAMQRTLEQIQPVLAKSTVDMAEMMVVIDREQAEAESIRVIVAADEAVANAAAQEAKAIRDECEAELAAAAPLVTQAHEALQVLRKQDISEVKSLKAPPSGVVSVMEALCIMMDVPPVKKPVDGNMVADYWEAAKKNLLSDLNLLRRLTEYDQDNIDPKIIKRVLPLIQNPDMDPEVIFNVSVAAHGLWLWVRAMVQYDAVMKVVAPKKEQLAIAEAKYEEVAASLAVKREGLDAVNKRVAAIQKQLQACADQKAEVANQISITSVKLQRAEKLIGMLGGEVVRWLQVRDNLDVQLESAVGDLLISAGVGAYLGGFPSAMRQRIVSQWLSAASDYDLKCSRNYSLLVTLTDPVQLREWHIQGLPTDAVSEENAAIMAVSRKWPLMVDPQGQANKWIRAMEAANGLYVLTPHQQDWTRKMEAAIQVGKPVLLEDVTEAVDPILMPLLAMAVVYKSGMATIQWGASTIPYSDSFKLYMTTQISNPHFLPEVTVNVTLLNFTVTEHGLADQVLSWVVNQEEPELEAQRQALIVSGAQSRKQLQEIEGKILRLLSASRGNILDDSAAIDAMDSSKVLASELAVKQASADKTEAELEAARAAYIPISKYVTTLFFCIADLTEVDNMYQYSLEWFMNIFQRSIQESGKSDDKEIRGVNINTHFGHALFDSVSRSLFARHQLLFAFHFATRVAQAQSPATVPAAMWQYLVSGASATFVAPEKEAQWLTAKEWLELCAFAASDEPLLKPLLASVNADSATWQAWLDDAAPMKATVPAAVEPLPTFARLCILRAVRPEKMIAAMQTFVAEVLGNEFCSPPTPDLAVSYADMSPQRPLIFLLSPGMEPLGDLQRFAEQQRVILHCVSLGEGQGQVAEKLIGTCSRTGGWVLLQNCHLYPSWLPALGRIVHALDKSVHSHFRLWLTSYPTAHFPVPLLRNSVKMTNEALTGVRGMMLSAFQTYPLSNAEFFGECRHGGAFKRLLYSLVAFHAIVQERRLYGGVGWNVPYTFSPADLTISARQLRSYLDLSDSESSVSMKTLKYLIGECNYGGRVTDKWDIRCLRSLLAAALDSPTQQLGLPSLDASIDSHESMMEFIRALPTSVGPVMLGLSQNADLIAGRQEFAQVCNALGGIKSGWTTAAAAGSSHHAEDAAALELVTVLLGKLPADFNLAPIKVKFPLSHEESLNTFLWQELERYNTLLRVVRVSLQEIRLALVGSLIMDENMEAELQRITSNRVPLSWMAASYPSEKPLGSYLADLSDRVQHWAQWASHGRPPVTWMGSLFFAQAFLTALLQNFSRKSRVPIDELEFSFTPVTTTERRRDGAVLTGMFLQGAAWDTDSKCLCAPAPKQLFAAAPSIWFLPVPSSSVQQEANVYLCPVYRTVERRGQLSTTGHSTNFVVAVKLATSDAPDVWVRRGAALIISLDD